jgi:Serine aminopeptidase, S33
MPVGGLVELHKIADELSQRLPEITCPVTILHGSNDPVVDPESAKIIHDRVGSSDKKLHIVASDRHGILYEDIDNTQAIIISRLGEFAASNLLQAPAPLGLLPNVNAKFLRLISPLISGRKTADEKRAFNRT